MLPGAYLSGLYLKDVEKDKEWCVRDPHRLFKECKMKYDKRSGVYYFSGEEDNIVFQHMWDCLTDLSFCGMIETLWRIVFKKPPERYWDYKYR